MALIQRCISKARVERRIAAELRQPAGSLDVAGLVQRLGAAHVIAVRVELDARDLALVREPAVKAEHIVLRADQNRRRSSEDEHELNRMLDERTEVKGIDDLDDRVKNDHAEYQTRPHPELAADQAEAERGHEAHDKAHENLDREAESAERQRRTGAFALSYAEREHAERDEERGRCRIDEQQTEGGLTRKLKFIHQAAAVFRAVDREILNRRAQTQVVEHIAHIAAVGLAEQREQALAQHLHRDRREEHPELEQQRDDRVAADDGRERAHRKQQQEKDHVAEDNAEQRFQSERRTEAHCVCAGHRQRSHNKVGYEHADRAGRVVDRIQLFARYGQAVVKVHLAAVMQIGEHHRADHDREHKYRDLDQRIFSAEPIRNRRKTPLPVLLDIERERAGRDHVPAVFERVLHLHERRQQHRHKERERRKHDRPKTAAHAVTHKSLRRGAS